MKILRQNLDRQLYAIVISIIIIIVTFLGVILPNALLPIYEKNIYQYLKQPLDFVSNDINNSNISNDIAFLYITEEEIISSDNFNDVIKISPKQILKYITDEQGKFKYLGNIYYYNTSYNKYVTKISLTNDNYLKEIKRDILDSFLPILLIILILISGLLIIWSRRLILKIEYLKDKIDNIDRDDYEQKYQYHFDDELKVLSDAIDNMHFNLVKGEEYKNQMYQNISHDFKTPLAVIKSYIEAFEDDMVSEEEVRKVIKEQVNKLESKVHSLLYLNKLSFIKDADNMAVTNVDIAPILKSSIEKFKYHRSDIKWEIYIKDKNNIYRGTEDMWEAIIDNFLNNFIRYADKKIKITLKNNRIIFYNDGPNIDEKILDDIFTPYKKGIKGEFGLGLSIIKNTVKLCSYEVSVKNERKGVTFMIK